MKHGLYKVLIDENDTEPKIARLTKNSGWQWEGKPSKMIRAVGVSHPWKVLERIEE